ncbi:MAG: Undecaprenyl-phosphate 4-deoxy-4-formamido-L-arabinose transferase [bacterium ADurb.Bin236]|nr:MAG: Undecaprenyl-phosphate 4-deoxy-4-formamido-L-arabinose transferase [bacterium ADurb.Bin236]HOY62837.1 glycosyltransferase family 2 protein [bacterium]HPN94300.1 glycosyltransferase family 2 protein [bacterium]
MDRHRLAIIIPAFNEAATIKKVVDAASAIGVVIVANDASSDETALEAGKSGAIVVSHEKNLGYDAALSLGFAEASRRGFEFAATMDADSQHNPENLKSFAAALEAGADVVSGVRPFRARAAESLFSSLTDFLCGIKDPMCGMKGYRMAVYEKLGHFDSYKSIGSELILFAAKLGMRIEQIGISIAPRAGASRFGSSLRANAKIFRAAVIGIVKYSCFRRPKYSFCPNSSAAEGNVASNE